MALAMTRPWKHPKTGMYWLRKRVPDDLRTQLGKREEKRSLETRDPAEAKQRLAAVLVELDKRWANLRAGPRVLTEREAHEIAVRIHDAHLARYLENPSQHSGHEWDATLGDLLWEARAPSIPGAGSTEADKKAYFFVDATDAKRAAMRAYCESRADEIIASDGLVVDVNSRFTLMRTVAAAMQRASRTLQRYANGSYIGAPVDGAVNAIDVQHSPQQRRVTFKELLEGWAKENKPAEKTIYSWTKVFGQFAKFLGHDEAQRVTADDVVRWKAALIESGLKAKSIRDSRLAPIRAVFGWGVDNRRLTKNVAERITIDVKAKPSERRRGYTDEEAILLLRAARTQKVGFRRWVPWLCAYTGARVSEICQLRAEDVREVEGIWCLAFTAEAGSLKNISSERLVPLHSAILDEGILDFVRKRKAGPLFPDLSPDRFGSRGGNGTKVLGRWVRDLGITDSRISPNHSWRHRLKTAARRHGLATDIVDAIVGHQRRTVADSYGEFPISALQRELEKVPKLNL
ncbi:MAG: site-specific integrase [Proteobacteria bacterium]|nr:site-specific integrase [Pseudomonadota bacterium]